MRRFSKACGASLLISLYVMCFYYAFAIAQALVLGTNLFGAVRDTFVVGTVFFIIVAFAMNEFYGFIDERDAREAAERKKKDAGENKDEIKK